MLFHSNIINRQNAESSGNTFMKIYQYILLTTFLTVMINAQDSKILIADGMVEMPKKLALQPSLEDLSANELEAVKKTALEKEVEFATLPQMSSEESTFKKDFELLDIAEGFFIYREIEFRAYLYTAYSEKIKRNYQGLLVFNITNNGTKFIPKAHYVYEYRGDKFLRRLSDINGNVLNELAIFSEPPTKKGFRKFVRIIEFSPKGLVRMGRKEIFSSVQQKQRSPNLKAGQKSKKIYIPPIVSATKLYAVKDLGKPLEFYEERWRKTNDFWQIAGELPALQTIMDEDSTSYIELLKPVFPKGPGEK